LLSTGNDINHQIDFVINHKDSLQIDYLNCNLYFISSVRRYSQLYVHEGACLILYWNETTGIVNG